MKVAIPSIVQNPTLDSDLSECPRSAKSILIYNTATGIVEVVQVAHELDKPCEHIPKLVALGVTDFVSGKCCKDHFDEFRRNGITVWKSSTAVNIRDLINNFLLCGAWIPNEAFVPEHGMVH